MPSTYSSGGPEPPLTPAISMLSPTSILNSSKPSKNILSAYKVVIICQGQVLMEQEKEQCRLPEFSKAGEGHAYGGVIRGGAIDNLGDTNADTSIVV